jgi:hypothetical protein
MKKHIAIFYGFCALLGLFGILLIQGCGETAGTGLSVSIPAVQINCTTARCRSNTNPKIFVYYTSSGCAISPEFGLTRSGSTSSINCTVGAGCQGIIAAWIDSTGSSSTTIPNGTYSVCGYVDYTRNNISHPTAGESLGTINSSTISNGTATQTITLWSDI